MSQLSQMITDFWPIALIIAGSIGGVAAFYLNVLRIRELQDKLRTAEEERKKSCIILPSTDEVKRYSSKTWEAAAKRARSYNIAIILMLIAALPFGYYYLNRISPRVASISKMEILRPSSGSQVFGGSVVEFRSPYQDLYHYILVTPLESPDRWVVDGPIKVLSDGTGTGRARFGSGEVGVGKSYAITVLATKALLHEGILTTTPENARFSAQIVVNRIK